MFLVVKCKCTFATNAPAFEKIDCATRSLSIQKKNDPVYTNRGRLDERNFTVVIYCSVQSVLSFPCTSIFIPQFYQKMQKIEFFLIF